MRHYTISRLMLAAVAVALTLGSGAAIDGNPPAPKTTPQAIEGSVICQCGCNMTVSGCNHEGCGPKAEMEAMAEKEVASGKDTAAILQDFVLKYGTKVLATPPPSGFNLTVWILPICGGIIGLSLIVVLLRRWRRAQQSAAEATEPVPVDPDVMAEIEEEMKKVVSD
ncbi:MAG TPA: cytochrome c-type biogenesis protein CcmH [Terriglobia bacterium]|nr:cytochrome c-type biogenesis protein CcmH [Terriglobia bacterium]